LEYLKRVISENFQNASNTHSFSTQVPLSKYII